MAGKQRPIIKIDESKCNGCGLCVPNCMEGALQIIDQKARLVSDLFCDGLGACLGHCPQGAITLEQREAEPYDEAAVMEQMIPKGMNTVHAHLEHLKAHGAQAFYEEALNVLNEKGIQVPKYNKKEEKSMSSGCPGSRVMNLAQPETKAAPDLPSSAVRQVSQLKTWPVQLMLVPVNAPYFKEADLLIAADCVPMSYANFHADFMSNKIPIMGCPKLDDSVHYTEKLTALFQQNNIRSITVVHMEVPCCFGLGQLVKQAIKQSGKIIPLAQVNISVRGEVLD